MTRCSPAGDARRPVVTDDDHSTRHGDDAKECHEERAESPEYRGDQEEHAESDLSERERRCVRQAEHFLRRREDVIGVEARLDERPDSEPRWRGSRSRLQRDSPVELDDVVAIVSRHRCVAWFGP